MTPDLDHVDRDARCTEWRSRGRLVGVLAAGALVVLGGQAAVTGHSLDTTGVVGRVALLLALVIGLPHGAVDVVAPVLMSRGRALWALALIAYAGVAASVFAAWLLAPALVLVALLALAVLHFGAADASPTDSAAVRATTTVALGGIPVVVPLALHAAQVRGIVDGLSGGHPDLVTALARWCLPVVAVATLVTVLIALQRRDRLAALEPLLLIGLFLLVPPLVAFAAYYALWHSLRQGIELVEEVAGHRHLPGRAATVTVLRQAALPSALVIAVGALVVASGTLPTSGVALIAVLCLTVPHSVCAVLGRRRTSTTAALARQTAG